ncbi:MAG: hypothetical protein E7327_00355 [Clostridiales bacterium]|nr:hypothetical protein [Clostridiales bacterium]
MSEAILVAVISGACTLLGSLGGVMATSSLTAYRLKRLEEQVGKHNQVIERTFRLEGRMTEMEHEVRDLKEYHKP